MQTKHILSFHAGDLTSEPVSITQKLFGNRPAFPPPIQSNKAHHFITNTVALQSCDSVKAFQIANVKISADDIVKTFEFAARPASTNVA
jgi:hypothetical protein